MTSNSKFHGAKARKDDEFYTRIEAISEEVAAYLERDPGTFRGKSVLLPCDDPDRSAFTQYFADNFEALGLRRLISTSHVPGGQGKVLVLWSAGRARGVLSGDGDFRGAEVTALRDRADMVITNPPFSLFREFLPWAAAGGREFLVISPMNSITYRDIWPLVMGGRVWSGTFPSGRDMLFDAGEGFDFESLVPSRKRELNGKLYRRAEAIWLTNLDHGKRHQWLDLMSTADVLREGRGFKGRGLTEFERYDNYDAVEIPYVSSIPSDYTGVMGVPITFLDKFNPEQFEIVGCSDAERLTLSVNGVNKYKRIFIRHRRPSAA